MKRILKICVVLVLLASFHTQATTIGPSRILTCPYCHAEKSVINLTSGNTIGATYWSDNKRIAPMLPRVSPVQKCPGCGKYYFYGRQEETRYDTKEESMNTGELSFAEAKEAYVQFTAEGDMSPDEEISVRVLLFQAFNDYYYRGLEDLDTDVDVAVDEDDYALFVETGQWLIDNLITDDLLKAEFYREIGKMAEAQEILDVLQVVGVKEDLKDIYEGIASRVKQGDSRVFKLF